MPPKPKVKRGPRKIKAGVATLATKADDLDCKELEYQIQTVNKDPCCEFLK